MLLRHRVSRACKKNREVNKVQNKNTEVTQNKDNEDYHSNIRGEMAKIHEREILKSNPCH